MTDNAPGPNICGVLVHAVPARIDAVVAALNALEGVAVHRTAADGRIVTTVEDTAQTNAIDMLATIHRLDGVVAAGLVYHHFEEDAE